MMSSCGCVNCTPPCTSTQPGGCLQSTETGNAFVVIDDNCDLRVLDGEGIAVTKDGGSYNTDGKVENGEIPVNPDNTAGANSVLVEVDGTLKKIGVDAPDGSVLISKANRWIVSSLVDRSLNYQESKLRTGAVKIAGFVCAENGTVTIGTISPLPESFIYFDENKNLVYTTINDLTQKLLVTLCEQSTEVLDNDIVKGALVCTNNGIKKSVVEEVAPTVITHAAMPWFVIGTAGLNLNATQALFSFTPSLLPGYDAKYKTVWLHAVMVASSHGADYDISISVGGQPIIEGTVREQPNLSGDFINPTLVFPFPITGAAIPVVKTVHLAPPQENTYEVFEMKFALRLVGWST